MQCFFFVSPSTLVTQPRFGCWVTRSIFAFWWGCPLVRGHFRQYWRSCIPFGLRPWNMRGRFIFPQSVGKVANFSRHSQSNTSRARLIPREPYCSQFPRIPRCTSTPWSLDPDRWWCCWRIQSYLLRVLMFSNMNLRTVKNIRTSWG